MTVPRIAITLGDPRGIGPEVCSRALREASVRESARFLLVGPRGVAEGAELLEVGSWRPGGSAAEAGRVAGEAIRQAVRLALEGEVDAIVTAPIDKNALRAGGWSYPGHTEMLQDLTGAAAVGMMMSAERTLAGSGLRVVLATTHLALRDVPRKLTTALVVEQARLTASALRTWWSIEEPRLGIGALNPHASDGGLFGNEEATVLAPAIELLRSEGIDAAGPVPADTLFVRALRGEFDAVLSPTHDVGMAAFKTVAFGAGVNVTLGLPFPRTSPDHGTALDIAGTGSADPASMIEAIRLAIHLAGRFDTTARSR